MTDQRDWAADSPGVASGDLDEDTSMEVEAIETEIVETRSEMTATVDAIGQKLDPANVVEGAKETVRAATVGKVEEMANTAGQMVEDVGATAQQAGSGILETIKRNPIPAAMVGVGLGLLWMNRQTSTMQGWSTDRWSSSSHGAYGSGAYGSGFTGSTGYGTGFGGQSMGGRSSGSGGSGENIGERVGRTAGETAENVRELAEDAGTTVRQTAQQFGRTTGDIAFRAERVIEQNPLGMGALALAAGAAIAMALPSTRFEQQTIGQAGQRLLEGAESAVEKPLQQMEDQARQG